MTEPIFAELPVNPTGDGLQTFVAMFTEALMVATRPPLAPRGDDGIAAILDAEADDAIVGRLAEEGGYSAGEIERFHRVTRSWRRVRRIVDSDEWVLDFLDGDEVRALYAEDYIVVGRCMLPPDPMTPDEIRELYAERAEEHVAGRALARPSSPCS